MQNDDLDALAAEYVLGTLAPDERAHAESLIGTDPGFAEIVRQWERRLGELNVMVEAVEPPDQVWEKLKSEIGITAASEPAVPLAPGLPPMPPAANIAESAAESAAEAAAEAEPGAPAPSASMPERPDLPASEQDVTPPTPSSAAFTLLPPTPTAPADGRGAEVLVLSRRVRRWKGLTAACGLIAAALVALIVVSQVRPDLIPVGGFHIPQLVAGVQAPQPSAKPPTPAGGRLVAVLQQDPSGPAFLLTIDPVARMLTVRRVAAKIGAGHSFELWLIAPNTAKPVALGVVGADEYTQRPLPANFDAATLRESTYAVSFEPAGGSKTGSPTGPVLFTGKLIQAVPPASAQKS